MIIEQEKSKKIHRRKRANVITFRMDDNELQLFNEKIKKYNLSKQAYFLFMALEKPIIHVKDLSKLTKINTQLVELIKQTRGIANNINQLTMLCHLHYAIPECEQMSELKNEFTKIRDEEDKVWRLLKQLISQLKDMGL